MVGEGCSCEWLSERLQAPLITESPPTRPPSHGDHAHRTADNNANSDVLPDHSGLSVDAPLEGGTDPPAAGLVLLDCRGAQAYSAAHVRGSLLVTLPPIVLRRLQRGAGSAVASLVPPERRAAFAALCRSATVVLYNEAGLAAQVVTSPLGVDAGDSTAMTSSVEGADSSAVTSSGAVLTLLLARLEAEGCRVRYLQGRHCLQEPVLRIGLRFKLHLTK